MLDMRHRAEASDVDVRGIEAGSDELIVIGTPDVEAQAIASVGREPAGRLQVP